MTGYSDYLTPGRLEEQEEAWSKLDRSKVIDAIMESDPGAVVEFCCGTGWIPHKLPLWVNYQGIDCHEGCLALARKKNPFRDFVTEDVREHKKGNYPFDVAVAFAALKHFTLDEWDGVYSKILKESKRTICSVYLHSEDKEDEGLDFPHTAVSIEHLTRVIKANGHRLLGMREIDPMYLNPEPLVFTCRN